MAGLKGLRADDDLSDIETYAVEVYRLLLPREIGDMIWQPVHHATQINDRVAFEHLLGLSVAAVSEPFETMENDGGLLVSPNDSSALAEALCHAHPSTVSERVLEQEQRQRTWTRTGQPAGVDRETRGTSAEWEWRRYREMDRPMHELMRSWCGHRAVTAHERRVTAEAEVHRLEVLATDLLDPLRKGWTQQADPSRGAPATRSHHGRDH